jgi:DNA mismatch repair protein MutS2
LSRKNEIYLRHLRWEEAQLKLRKELDIHYMAGKKSVRIVHGKGTGVLKNMTREYLALQPFVKNYYEAPFSEGGAGVTIADFDTWGC